jgi:phage-related protein
VMPDGSQVFSFGWFSRGWNHSTGSQCRALGPGVREIRIHTAVEHRVCYVAKFVKAIYVLHAFEKGTRKTSQHDVEVARQRYQALVACRER